MNTRAVIRCGVALGALAIFVLFIVGCGGSGGTTTTSSNSSSPTPAEGEGQASGEGEAGEPTASTGESGEDLVEPSSEWPTDGGNLSNQRYSTTTEITPENVSGLNLEFEAPLDPPKVQGSGRWVNPVEVDGVVYAASSSNDPTIGAYDATTGKQLWQKTASELTIPNPTSHGDQGESVGDGLVFVEEPGGYLVAVDEKTGELVWKALINTEHRLEESEDTPVYYDGEIITGLSGSNVVGGGKGRIKAYDAKTGKLLWTFNQAPELGEPAAKTWGTPKSRPHELANPGVAVWAYAAIDTNLGIAYVPTAEPYPSCCSRQGGDDLYSSSLLALDLKTGKLKWYFQAVRDDRWDYDCSQPVVLWDHEVKGKMEHGVSFGCKSGYIYELNRENGEALTPIKYEPLANADNKALKKEAEEKYGFWLTGHKPMTEPIPVGAGEVTPHCADPKRLPKVAPDGKPFEMTCSFSYYGSKRFTAGFNFLGLNYERAAYDPNLGETYYCANVGITTAKITRPTVKQTVNTKTFPQLYAQGEDYGPHEERTGLISALDVSTGKRVWQDEYQEGDPCVEGVTATATGLLFGEDGNRIYAYESKTGKQLWSWESPGVLMGGPPILYEQGGTEYLAFTVTDNGYAKLDALSLKAKPPAPEEESASGAGGSHSAVEIFTANCGSCHTLAAAKTTGAVGPNLDELKPNHDLVKRQVESGGDKMPSFKGILRRSEIEKVAEYVAKEAGKE
ncbi:MAG TPA: PQQ-binding-like beta-propeller repeat protein [Solirubrobacterales bacterium]|nr:PQQ-binding-like beta-propeller repeat protein [Solirubrobacterales bacterium]